jgi:uncharacterized membrane protein
MTDTTASASRSRLPALGYRAKLERDLERWQQAGLIDASTAAALRQDVTARRSALSLASVLAMLAAVLVAFGAMSFVAANWDAIPRAVRLVVIVAAVWGAYAGAHVLRRRGHAALAEAAIVLGIALFGAGIMLVAQMYHISGNPVDAVWTWAMGALAAGFLLHSPPALAVALGLFQLWSLWITDASESVHWGFPLYWAVVAAGFAQVRWRPGLHLAALSAAIWIVSLGYLLVKGGSAHALVALIGMALVALFAVAGPAIDRWRRISEAGLGYGALVAYAGLFALQFVDRPAVGRLAGLAVVTLVLILALVYAAWRRDLKVPLWLGYALFALEIVTIYFRTIGSLLGTSAFFLSAGLVLAGLAWLAVRLHRSSRSTEAEEVRP